MVELLYIFAAIAVFCLFVGTMMPSNPNRRDKQKKSDGQAAASVRPTGKGKADLFEPITKVSYQQSLKKDSLNARYLRQLKQANWFWEPGEPMKPNPKAPFWSLETLWSKKIMGALLWGGGIAGLIIAFGLYKSLTGSVSVIPFFLGGAAFGAVVGFFQFGSPDTAVAGAAATRQRELSLEMGYRIPELRGDVMAGTTIQRAIRNMSRRPGGPFVEELRRAVTVLDVTKDDTLAMDQLIDRNQGNELIIEFANNLKMVSRQGGQISPVLNVLADLAQERLRLQIQAQARKNLQEMTRPIGLSSMMITTMLIIVPAMAGVMGSIGGK